MTVIAEHPGELCDDSDSRTPGGTVSSVGGYGQLRFTVSSVRWIWTTPLQCVICAVDMDNSASVSHLLVDMDNSASVCHLCRGLKSPVYLSVHDFFYLKLISILM